MKALLWIIQEILPKLTFLKSGQGQDYKVNGSGTKKKGIVTNNAFMKYER